MLISLYSYTSWIRCLVIKGNWNLKRSPGEDKEARKPLSLGSNIFSLISWFLNSRVDRCNSMGTGAFDIFIWKIRCPCNIDNRMLNLEAAG